MFADLVLTDGNVLTLNSSQPSAEAVAVKDGIIVQVGTSDEIRRWIGDSTKVIDLQGRTVVPGFIDAHIHVGDFGRFLTWVNLNDAGSIQEVQRRLRERAQQISKGRWIIGNGWNQARFAEKRYPKRQDLDEASPDNPVVLYHECGRVCVVNSKALELAAVTKETVSPSGGTIEKDKGGEPTGVLRESATDLVWKAIPEPGEEEIIEGAVLACKKIVEAGVTSIHWIATSPTEIPVIQKLCAENKLPLRVYPIIPAGFLEQANSSVYDSKDGSLGVKVFVDGSLSARTAALREPYSDNPESKGQLLYSQQELDILVSKVHNSRLRLIIHAMGDQAINMALTAIEKALKETPKQDHRHRLEQASVLNKEIIHRIRELGLTVSVQPKCVLSEFSVWAAVDRLGSERARWLYPLKTLTNEGIRVIGGSDCPMEPLSPLQGIQAAVTRQFFPEEQITVDDALRMYTVNAAYASFEENLKGSIEEGKHADLIVLSGDPTTVQPSKIGEINVDVTIVGGKVVHQKLT